MFGFWEDKKDIEIVMRPYSIRSAGTYKTQAQLDAADSIIDEKNHYKNILGETDQKVLHKVFSDFSFAENGDPTPLYNVFHRTEQLIYKYQRDSQSPWFKKREELRAHTAKDQEDAEKHAEELAKVEKEIKNYEFNANQMRSRFYQSYFDYLQKKYGDNQKEIDRLNQGLTHWHLSGPDHDSEHASILNNIAAFKEAREKNEAYGNPWYMVAMGALFFTVGTAFFIASLVTGFAAPYLISFAALGLFGIGIAFLGGEKASQSMLAHRVNLEAQAALRSQAKITSDSEFKKPSSSAWGPITWQSAPLFLLFLSAFVLVVADFYLGGPLSVLGRAINISILPGFNVDIPNYDLSNKGYWGYNPLLKYFVNPQLEIFSGMGTPISSSALDFAILGIAGGAGIKILEFMTSFSNNKTFVRAHAAIGQMYNTVFYSYSLCGMIALPFSATLLPMLVMPFAAAFLCFALYQRFAKGNEHLTIPARPAMLGGMVPASPESNINYNSAIVASALATALCVICVFALASNPITFGVFTLITAAAYAVAQDQIKASAGERDAEAARAMVHKDLSNPKPAPVNNVVAPKPANTATTTPVQMSKPVPCVSVKPSSKNNARFI